MQSIIARPYCTVNALMPGLATTLMYDMLEKQIKSPLFIISKNLPGKAMKCALMHEGLATSLMCDMPENKQIDVVVFIISKNSPSLQWSIGRPVREEAGGGRGERC